MINADQIVQLKDLLPSAKTVIVVLPRNANLDQASSALALASGLQFAGKQVTVVSPQPLPQHLEIAGKEQVQTELGNKDLTVSFDYQPETVDKVSYHIDNDQQKFFLVIKPQAGHKPLDQSSVKFSLTGAQADLIFLVGVNSFESLDQIYTGYEQLYQDTTTVVINPFEASIGNIKLDTSGSSSLSEAMVGLMANLGLPLAEDQATNLLSAIENQTQSFASLATTATTFETVAILLRQGARRLKRKGSNQDTNPFSAAMRAAAKNQPKALPAEDRPKLPAETQSSRKNHKNRKKPGDLNYQPSVGAISGG